MDVARLAAILLDRELRVRSFTPGAVDLLMVADADIGRLFAPILEREFFEEAAEVLQNAADSNRTVEREVRSEGGTWYLMRVQPVASDDPHDAMSVTFFDIDRWHHWKDLHLGHARVLEMLATGRPLPAILERLVLTIEDQIDDVLASVLLIDHQGAHLLHGAAPSLPSEYNRAVNGLAIGPEVGSCGTAAYRGERVIVEDTMSDPLWASYRDVAGRFGIGSCWSEPIKSTEGRVLGTFAMYHREPRTPERRHLRLIEWAAHVASIAIERTIAMDELRRTRDHLTRTVEIQTRELNAIRCEARRQQAELCHMARLSTVGEMSAMLVHELAQPLSAVVTSAEACRRSADFRDPALLKRLGDLVEEAQRATTMIGRLRTFARKTPPTRTPHDLNAVLLELVPLMQVEAERHGATILVDTSPDPQAVLVDPVGIQQVVLNLARNGMEAMAACDDGERQLRVRICRAGESDVQLSVADVGEGISTETLSRIFEPFYTSKTDGLGLGLSISRRIINTHGGRLWAVPNRDRGVTFRLTLPLVDNKGVTP